MTTIAMSVEGVLVDYPSTDTILNYEATDQGRNIFGLLKTQARIVLFTTDPYEDRIKQWLLRERLTGHAMLYTKPVDSVLSACQWKVEKMTGLMGIGHRFAYYVDTDPAAVDAVMSVGITGLLLAIPRGRPGQDKPTNPTPWYDLVKRVDEQNALRAKQAQEDSEYADSNSS
jgi:hypothetical protein